MAKKDKKRIVEIVVKPALWRNLSSGVIVVWRKPPASARPSWMRPREYDLHLTDPAFARRRLERGLRMARALLARRFGSQPVTIDGIPIMHEAK